MENSLIFMDARAERFTKIKASLKDTYYDGASRSFYLRDNTKQSVQVCKIRNTYRDYDRKRVVYELDVPTIDLSHDYELENAYGMTCPLQIKGIVNDPKFDEMYSYDGDDLGPTYTKEYTSFKVWAPTASQVLLDYSKDGKKHIEVMERQNRGVYYCKVDGDLDRADYVYLVKNDGVFYEATDPYAYSSTINSKRSSIIDLDKIVHHDYPLPPLESKTDAIIYEISIRDFTSSVYSGIENRGKFLGLTEKNTTTPSFGSKTGLDYIKDLGITHVQILPMYDFVSVEELNPTLLYNWGYDPQQYNVPEGSFATNPNDPYSRVQECIKMIETFHSVGIKVNMDVVFNHVYNVNNHAFERIVPHYYFRNNDEGVYSNGSGCSNDLNTCSMMVRKYIIDMCKRWMELYKVDGYRFDLMGIIDVYTMNKVEKVCRAINPETMIYGEGWNMGTMLPDHDKAMQDNYMNMPNIGFFSDRFRNSVRGPNGNTPNNEVGYFAGNTNKIWDMMRYMKNYDVYLSPEQSINYCECHDNETCADKLAYTSIDNRQQRMNRLTMMLSSVLLSIGVPFIHSGQEFYRTKHGIANSYNAADDINQIKWQARDRYQANIETVQSLIQLRKDNPGFRYNNPEDIKRYVSLIADEGVILEKIRQPNHKNEEILVIYNPTYSVFEKEIDDYEVFYQMGNGTSYHGSHLVLDEISMIILIKKHQ